MDVQTIDQQYSQLQNASQQVAQELKELATKLQAESTSGNQQAREWVLDLKEIALAIHGFVANQNQAYNAGYPAPTQGGYPQPGFVGAPMTPQPSGGLGGFLQSGFGRAMEMGLGFGLGDDLMRKLF